MAHQEQKHRQKSRLFFRFAGRAAGIYTADYGVIFAIDVVLSRYKSVCALKILLQDIRIQHSPQLDPRNQEIKGLASVQIMSVWKVFKEIHQSKLGSLIRLLNLVSLIALRAPSWAALIAR